MNNKTIISGIIGGVAFFLLGWLIYGMMLDSFMKENMSQAVARKMEEMVWWALILSCFVNGYFLSLMLGWSNTQSMSIGLQKGAIIGLLIGLGMDLGMHAMSTVFLNMNALIVDVAACTVMNAIVGGIIGMIMGMGKKTA
ncbi:MAG: hypothetical protein SGJ10_10835 [Bacteroidota bacterium]|nr:hypothetical protein [Bacteroidota bacterium]